jgi:hypothetical protein
MRHCVHILFLVSIIQASYSQIDSSFKYFPLHNGNVCKYISADSSKTSTLLIDFMQSRFETRHIGVYVNENYADEVLTLRLDSTTGNIVDYFTGGYFDNVVVQPDSSSDGIVCDSIVAANVLGLAATVRHMRACYSYFAIDTARYCTAMGLGIISGDQNHLYGQFLNTPFTLAFACIGGKYYGQALTRSESDSMLQYHFFQKGDKWIYRFGNYYYGTPDELDRSWLETREMTGDTIIGGKKYVIFDGTAFQRYDSVSGNIYARSSTSAEEMLYDTLLCGNGNSSPSGVPPQVAVSSVLKDTILGRVVPSRGISVSLFWDSYAYRKFAWRIGLVTMVDGGMAEYTRGDLVYAKIGGVEYGQLPTSMNDDGSNTPLYYELLQNYPNPFNPTTVISYRLPIASKVSLKVYDLLGREVATLVDGMKEAGSYSSTFAGSNAASGVYLYILTTPRITIVKKMLLTK